MTKAEQLLYDINEQKPVSRWDVSIHRKEIKQLLKKSKFKHLADQVQDLIESANLSR